MTITLPFYSWPVDLGIAYVILAYVVAMIFVRTAPANQIDPMDKIIIVLFAPASWPFMMIGYTFYLLVALLIRIGGFLAGVKVE